MSGLLWLVVLGVAVYSAWRWNQNATALPQGYSIRTVGGALHPKYELKDPDGVVIAYSQYTDIWGERWEYRKMVQIANMNARRRV